MKKSLICLCILVICILLTGCKEKKTIVGDWIYDNGGFAYHFDKDGKGSFSFSADNPLKFTYTEKDGNVNIKYEGYNNVLKATWKDDEFTIKSSNGNDMVYKRKITDKKTR